MTTINYDYYNISTSINHIIMVPRMDSTEICAILHEIKGGTDRKSSVHEAVLDLSKVFDCVPYALLTQKQSDILGINRNLLIELDT